MQDGVWCIINTRRNFSRTFGIPSPSFHAAIVFSLYFQSSTFKFSLCLLLVFFMFSGDENYLKTQATCHHCMKTHKYQTLDKNLLISSNLVEINRNYLSSYFSTEWEYHLGWRSPLKSSSLTFHKPNSHNWTFQLFLSKSSSCWYLHTTSLHVLDSYI